jgi:hypothetical protein
VTKRSQGWILGWAAGLLVVVIAAGLLVTNILLARRIVAQARDITEALDNARRNSNGLFGLTDTNVALRSITRDLRAVREGRS